MTSAIRKKYGDDDRDMVVDDRENREPENTENTEEPTPQAGENRAKESLGLSLPQVVAGALASVSSALVASVFGVAGTLIGAALGSVIATVAAAVYARTLRTAGGRLRSGAVTLRSAVHRDDADRRDRGEAAPSDDANAHTGATAAPITRRRVGIGVGTLAAFAIAIGGITAAESVVGHPVSSSSGSGTSIGTVLPGGSGAADTTPVDETEPTDVPTVPGDEATPADGDGEGVPANETADPASEATPEQTRTQAPQEAPGEAPGQPAESAPAQAPEQAPADAPAEAPAQAPDAP